jgi:putative thioredoxin
VSDFIVNIDESNAAQLLIEESHNRPVVVAFWADWSEPCKVIMPILEKIANEYQGAFLLAHVNADQQQGITQQFGVRSLPTVMVIQNGQPVDGLADVQAEVEVRELLAKYLPKPWDGLLQMAQEAIEKGDFASALSPLRMAWDESGQQYDITVMYVHALIECLRLDEAANILAGIRMADQDSAYEQLIAQLDIKREAAKSPELEALVLQLAADPDNLDLRCQLAVQYTSTGQFKEAMEYLVGVLTLDREHNNGGTKKTLLDTIASLGKGDPLAAEYQRKLYSLLY